MMALQQWTENGSGAGKRGITITSAATTTFWKYCRQEI